MQETLIFLLRNGVEGVGLTEGVAAKQPLQCKKTALDGTVLVDCFVCVSAAGGTKPTASGSVGRDAAPVKGDEG